MVSKNGRDLGVENPAATPLLCEMYQSPCGWLVVVSLIGKTKRTLAKCDQT